MSLNKIHKYVVECDGPGCNRSHEYETQYKNEMPGGWYDDSQWYSGSIQRNRYCAECWRAHCLFWMSNGKPGYEEYLKQLDEREKCAEMERQQ